MRKILISMVAVLLSLSCVAGAAETKSERDARMKWFREAHFGMFICWGLYSVPAGEYKDRKDLGEWFLLETKMPLSEYAGFAKQFNPVKFDAKEWVRIAKNAGIKYVVMIANFMKGGDWETCMTMNQHWAYNKNDQNWKSTELLVRGLVDCASTRC